MRFSRHLRGQKGFTLLEAMITLGLLAVAGLAAASLINMLFRSKLEMQSKVAARDLVEDMRSLLGFSDICELNFKGQSVDALPQPYAFILAPTPAGTPAVRYAVDRTYEQFYLKVLSITIQNYVQLTATDGILDLSVRLSKTRDTGTVKEIDRQVPLMVSLNDPTGRLISSCYALGAAGSDPKKSCENLGGRFILGASESENRCIFQQAIVSDDPNLPGSSALLHVRSGTNDSLVVMPDGRTGINYSITGGFGQPVLPSIPGTRLFVAGDYRVTGNTYSDKVMTSQVVIAPQAELDAYATSPGNPYYSAPPYAPYGENWLTLKNAQGMAQFGHWSNGQPSFDGGADGVVHITISGEQAKDDDGGFGFNYAPDHANTPYPTNIRKGTLTMLNKDARVGVGYDVATMAPSSTFELIPKMNDTKYGHTFTDVRFFVRDSVRVEKDIYATGQVLTPTADLAKWIPYSSDLRWKRDVRPIENASRAVNEIDGVYHRWKQTPESPVKSEKTEIGFIAQEVEEHFPEAVWTDSKGYKLLDYARLLPVLWQAFKERHARNEALALRIERLKAIQCPKHPEDELCLEAEDTALSKE